MDMYYGCEGNGRKTLPCVLFWLSLVLLNLVFHRSLPLFHTFLLCILLLSLTLKRVLLYSGLQNQRVVSHVNF